MAARPPHQRSSPGFVAQAAAALAAVLLTMVVRVALELVVPGIIPFALLYPAVLGVTLVAGWGAGCATLALGGAAAWYALFEPRYSFTQRSLADVGSILLYLVAAGAIVGLAEAFRRRNTSALRDQAALRESETRVTLATSAAGVGIWEWRLGSDEVILSPIARTVYGLGPDEPPSAAAIAALAMPEDRERTLMQRRWTDPALKARSEFEYRIRRPDGEIRWLKGYAQPVSEPGPDGAPVVVRYVGASQDITEYKRAQQVLQETASRLALALDAAHMAVWELRDGVLIPNPELNRLLGFAPDARPTLADLEARFDPGEFRRLRRLSRRVLGRGGRFFEIELGYRRPDGGHRWLLGRAEFRPGPDGRAVGALGVVLDITERKAAEDRVQLLAREVDHRANNLLTIIQGLVTLSDAPDVAELKEVLRGRIAALGRAHQLLSQARWQGADLRRLVEEEVEAYSLGDGGRVSITGEETALGPPAAQAIAMAVHELATNAAKYGALSVPEGRVEVSWTGPGERELVVRWAEVGGPPVVSPQRRGLGAAMLSRALGGPLQGSTHMDWRPEGLVCELRMPRALAMSLGVSGAT